MIKSGGIYYVPISLPSYLSARSCARTVAACHSIHEPDDDVRLDASRLRFVDPFGLTLLGAAFHELHVYGHRVQVAGLSDDLGGYLNRMDLFEGVEFVDCAPPSARRWDRSDSLVELTRLSDPGQVSEASYRLGQALVGRFPGIDPEESPDEMTGYRTLDRLIEPIQYTLSELLENALTHARKRGHRDASVWVAGQYYRSRDLVQLAVTDNGCGFLETLRGHPDLRRDTHHEAILAALRPRVSCNRDLGIRGDSVNQGVGLTTAVRIAEHSAGKALVVSGDAMHDTERMSGSFQAGGFWQGVSVAMEFRRDRLTGVRLRDLLPPLEGTPLITLRFE